MSMSDPNIKIQKSSDKTRNITSRGGNGGGFTHKTIAGFDLAGLARTFDLSDKQQQSQSALRRANAKKQ